MCGIVGIIEKKGEKPQEKKLQSMMRSVVHRGPDDGGSYLTGSAALGHRRLSILDTSEAGHQPMRNAKGSATIVYNGEVYNYLEIKRSLKRKNFKSRSDTEVLLAAYDEWGKECVKKCNGIFAFALWDNAKKELFCARDHLGVKPFYYAFQNGVFYFGSEIKALLAAGVRTKPNKKIWYDYLGHGLFQHTDETFFENIHQLPAGCTLTYKNGKISIERYWDLAESVRDLSDLSEKEVHERFMKLIKSSVKFQLRSDVPVGIQLSGGLDSSLITALVDDAVRGQKNFRLFSFAYGKFKDRELPFMKSLSDKLNWENEFFYFYPEDMSRLMDEVVWHQDEPFPGLPTFGLHLLGQACRENNILVVLGGQGGDEVGAGYEYYMGAFFLDLIRVHGTKKALDELHAYGVLHQYSETEAKEFLVRALASYLQGGTSADGTSFVNTEVLNTSFVRAAKKPRPSFPEPFDNALQNMQYRDIVHTKLPRILHSADRAAMAHGVEQRVPFVDHRLMEFGLSLPMTQKIHHGQQRYFVREAVRELLPKIVNRAPKRAVPSPQREWFKRELRPWIQSTLSAKKFYAYEFLDQKKVLAEYSRYCRVRKNPNSFHIWQWIHLENWMRTYFK